MSCHCLFLHPTIAQFVVSVTMENGFIRVDEPYLLIFIDNEQSLCSGIVEENIKANERAKIACRIVT